MIKKAILFVVFSLNIGYICYSQLPQGERFQKAQQAFETYLTKEISLSPEEADKLRPVYKEYFINIRTQRKENNSDPIAMEEKILATRKKYKEEFKKILGSEERVNKLLLAERNFKDILRKELMQRRMNRQGTKDPGIQ